jgi:hydrophobe/amphiphile efflux-1 (HAE1) family protein
MKLSDISIRRPVFATMMISALLVLGWFSYSALTVQMFPDMDFPFVVVQTVYPGASPETIENDVTKKIEEAINQVSGVRNVQSRAQEGYTFTFIEFELGVDGNVASQKVREKVSGIRGDLPDDIEEPIVSQLDVMGGSIISMTVSGRRSEREITQLVKDYIKPRLETISGVGSIAVVGGKEREILVALNPQLMESYEVSVGDVQGALAMSNLEIPGGRVNESDREYTVRVKGKLTSVEQFNTLVVKNNKGTPVFLSDVARVVDTIVEQRSLARFNGSPAVAIGVNKQSGANVVDLARGVRATVESLQKEVPPDIKIDIITDDSVFIQDSISEIIFNIEFGTILAVLVIFLFLLDIRPTIITGLSIPISVIATFTAIRFMGFNINFMTLLGLSLAVGILIDDSIVVVENIYRKIAGGDTPFQAAFSGTAEIGLAVMATTFSIVAVFLPVAFMSGIIGRIFYQFGMTVSFAVLISLFVAFTLVPMLASRTQMPREDEDYLNPDKATGWWRLWLRIRRPLSIWERTFEAIKPFYTSLLERSLRHRGIVMIVAVLAFVAAIGMVGAGLIGTEFMSASDEGKLYVTVNTPPGSTLEDTSDRVARLETILMGLVEVKSLYITVGGDNTPVTDASILAILTDATERKLSAKGLVDSVRTLLSSVPGVKLAIATEQGEGGGSKPVELSIRGENRDELIKITHQVQRIMAATPGTVDVDNSLEEGKPEFQLSIDRQAADDLGVNVMSISQTIRNLVEGDAVTRYKEGDQDYDVRIRLDEQFRNSGEEIGRILVASGKDVPGYNTFLVPINRVATIEKAVSIGEYSRYNRLPEVRVNANTLSGFYSGTMTNQITSQIDSLIQLPPGYTIAPVGEYEIMAESFTSITGALILAVIFIYLLIGAIVALWAWGSSINIMTMVGIVMLMGLVTKNAILLIDFVKQQREAGLDRSDAILHAGPVRLRPILMTTFAMVFGMLPAALGIGPGAEMRAPMARAVIGGIISSTLLTLVVVPVVYTLIDDFVGFFRRKKKTVMTEVETVKPMV